MGAGLTAVVLGGYGNFGAVIAARLAAMAGLEVIVAGRRLDQAAAQARRIGARACRLDAADPALAERLREMGAGLVVSTAGPFQDQDYGVARAAITARAHYIDIADGRDFVCGIAQLDAAAKAGGVLVVSGASSVPALSAAVIDHYQAEFAELRDIDYAIGTSEKTPGPATVAAVLGYCGKPIRQWREGAWGTVYGWQGLRRHDFGPPLGARWLANCDIPDLELFPSRYPAVRSVRFQAGLGLPATQFGLWALSWLVRGGLIHDAAPLAPALRRLALALEPFGNGRSALGMRLAGLGHDGRPRTRTWTLVARHNHGPRIPCMAAVALARKLAARRLPARGAMPCVGLVSLPEYLEELQGLEIAISASLRRTR